MDREARERIAATRRFLGDRYGRVPFVDTEEAEVLNARRAELLASIAPRLKLSASGSKPHVGELSPGCVRCGEGEWSCLFLNLKCGAACFFCPGSQPLGHRVTPRAESLGFERAEDYSEYVGRFGYRAVSFSGGDPLLSLTSVLDHLQHLRRRHGDGLYVWLYTNGLAADRDALESLRDAGLDEIRFNIAASGYSLDRVAPAARIFDRVTVEIPVIPEDVELVRERLAEMSRIGVRHLNLHQLMMIGGNEGELGDRGYRFSHGLTPPVPESEIAALSLQKHVLDEGLDLAIHYCSWAYKARWQVRAQDARLTRLVRLGFEEMSGRGLLRRIRIETPGDVLGVLADRLLAADPSGDRFLIDRDRGRVYLHSSLLDALDPGQDEVFVDYYRPLPISDADGERPFPGLESRQVRVDAHRTMEVSLHRVASPGPIRAADWPAGLEPFERMPFGLPDYV